MKQRPHSDLDELGVSGEFHAVPVLMPEPTWCQHRSWFFFPWHRIYLYWFERILRQASGDPELTLPYWNYSDERRARVLPPAFGEGFDARQPKFALEARRAPGINDGSLALSALTVAYEPAFSQINFSDEDPPIASFGGQKILGPDDEGGRAPAISRHASWRYPRRRRWCERIPEHVRDGRQLRVPLQPAPVRDGCDHGQRHGADA